MGNLMNSLSEKNRSLVFNKEIYNIFDKKKGLHDVLYGQTYRSIRKERKVSESNTQRKSKLLEILKIKDLLENKSKIPAKPSTFSTQNHS